MCVEGRQCQDGPFACIRSVLFAGTFGEAAAWPFERKLDQLWRVDVAATMTLARAAGARMKAYPIGGDWASDFVVVQGIMDLAVLLPGEIWLLDYKTDRVSGAQLEEKVKAYQPQLALYALALSRIYNRPVTRCWLYFLAAGKSVLVPVAGSSTR